MKKVLVIEDSPDVRSMINDMLSMSDFEILEAENGLQGVEVAQRQQPDLIVCDVQMPELDGFGVLARLRQSPITAGIPFIFLTGFADQPLMQQGTDLGADDYLTKPFTFQELLGAVQTRLQRSSARD